MGGSGLPSERAAFAWQEGSAILVAGLGDRPLQSSVLQAEDGLSTARSRAAASGCHLLKMLLKMS